MTRVTGGSKIDHFLGCLAYEVPLRSAVTAEGNAGRARFRHRVAETGNALFRRLINISINYIWVIRIEIINGEYIRKIYFPPNCVDSNISGF